MTVLNGSWPMNGTLGRSRYPTTLPIKRPAIVSPLFIHSLELDEGPLRLSNCRSAPSGGRDSRAAIGSFLRQCLYAMLSRDDLAEAVWLEMWFTLDRASVPFMGQLP